MKIEELTVTVIGPLWRVHDFEIEGIDVIERWEEEDGKGSVKVTDFDTSSDNILNVFVKLGAPNGTVYTVEMSGTCEEGDITYKEDFEVKLNGRLNINIEADISDLIKE